MHAGSQTISSDVAEATRLAALRRYAILDTPPEDAFDVFTDTACRLFGAPISLVSFVDADRQWFKSRRGLSIRQTPRAIAFCAVAIQTDRVCLVADARTDPRFADNELVTADPRLRFYAGAPLITPEGHRLGTLCVLDFRPRPDFSEADAALLARLAAQVMTELELRRNAAETAAIQRHARLGSWSWRPGARLLLCSEEIHRIFGASPRPFAPILRAIVAAIHPEDRAHFAAGLRAAWGMAAGDRPQEIDFRLIRPDGMVRHCHAEATAERSDDGRLLALTGYCQDITERREAELALRRSEKLHAIGQLTGGLAHDFNNLLTVVSLNLELLEAALPQDHPTLRHVRTARAAADSGAGLIARLLAFARGDSVATRRIEANALLIGVRALVDRSLGAGHALLLDLATAPLLVCVDPSQMESVLLNLVLNARDAMAGGGEIVISSEAVASSPAGHPQCAGYALIRVRDSGSGIAPAILARVTEPFFSTKPLGKGAGLGLSLAHGFARQAGGALAIDSGPTGTCVRLYLPIAARGRP